MPPSARNKKYSNNARGFNFCLDSYLDEIQIQMVLCEHTNHIKAAAYIYHDKDVKEDGTPKEPHWHILLCLYSQRYETSVRNWFMRWENENGDLINTLSQVCRDVPTYYRYLTHRTKDSKDKYRYSQDDIKGVNLDYFGKYDEQDQDIAQCALNDMLNGVPYRQIFARYGRDVMYHISQLQTCYLMIRTEEYGKHWEDEYI